ncbi:MAG: SDR family oxidoreductase [Armatimonadota bacterium]|nr:SDR family oxidoreductase [Armatimonadota bacterium]
MDLNGRVALVTGGAVRVGRAISLALAERGAVVAVNYCHSESAAHALAEEIQRRGGQAAPFRADLSVTAEIDRLVDAVTAQFGPIDVLVNNAAIFPRTPLESVTEETWDQVMAINLKAPFFCARRVGREMVRRGAGKIVNIADVSACHPWPSYIPYGVSKAGLVALTYGLARALAPAVQVNAVAPGAVLFPESFSEKERRRALALVPLKREGGAEAVARTVLFLIEGPDYITGAVVPVDGGRLLL